MDEITKIALEISRSQLALQKEDLRAVRGMATFSGSLSGAIAAIFLAVLFNGSGSLPESISFSTNGPIAVIALGLLLASLACSVLALSNWKDCTFELSAEWIFEHTENGVEENRICKSLALEAETFFDSNEKVIQGARNTVWWSLVLAWTQAFAWIILLLIN